MTLVFHYLLNFYTCNFRLQGPTRTGTSAVDIRL